MSNIERQLLLNQCAIMTILAEELIGKGEASESLQILVKNLKVSSELLRNKI